MTGRRLLVLFACLASLVTGCTGDDVGKDSGRAGVREVMVAWAKAYATGDGRTACDLMTEDGRTVALVNAGDMSPGPVDIAFCRQELGNGKYALPAQRAALRSLIVPQTAVSVSGGRADVAWSELRSRHGRLRCDEYTCAGLVRFARADGRWRIDDMYLP